MLADIVHPGGKRWLVPPHVTLELGRAAMVHELSELRYHSVGAVAEAQRAHRAQGSRGREAVKP